MLFTEKRWSFYFEKVWGFGVLVPPPPPEACYRAFFFSVKLSCFLL